MDKTSSAGILSLAGIYFLTRLIFIRSLPIFYDENIFRWAQDALYDGKWLISLTDGKPPLHVWLMVPFIQFSRDPLIGGRLASVLAGLFSLFGIVLLGRRA